SPGLHGHKFGVDIAAAGMIYARSLSFKHLRAAGVSCHVGSQILDFAPILEAAVKVLALIERLKAEGQMIDHVELGGGPGIAYQAADRAPGIREFIETLRARIGRD